MSSPFDLMRVSVGVAEGSSSALFSRPWPQARSRMVPWFLVGGAPGRQAPNHTRHLLLGRSPRRRSPSYPEVPAHSRPTLVSSPKVLHLIYPGPRGHLSQVDSLLQISV